ncbi:hypothetical protein [Rhodoplanes elegans]|uniref:hypothetical protein n=1 Tax=Rhodoplanes elegans TaxID=29408 RepID=UPI0019148439|nr:hypothetical protein [Rhodoplanes elegans]
MFLKRSPFQGVTARSDCGLASGIHFKNAAIEQLLPVLSARFDGMRNSDFVPVRITKSGV